MTVHYVLRRALSRYVRKKRLIKTRKKVETVLNGEPDNDMSENEDNDENECSEKIERAKKKIGLLLEKRREIKEKKEAIKVKLVK